MRHVMLLLGVNAVVSYACVSKAGAQVYVWSDVTEGQAAQTIRDFAGDPALELSYEGVQIGDALTLPWPAPWDYGSYWFHVFVAGHKRYKVSTRAPHVLVFHDDQHITDPLGFYGDLYSEDEFVMKAQQMPLEDARVIADAFVATHGPPEAPSYNDVLASSDPTTSTPDGFAAYYDFLYRMIDDNGALSPSFADISVDSILGRTVAYLHTVFPVLIDTVPVLTAEEAIGAAQEALIYSEPDNGDTLALMVMPPDELGLERLVWLVEVSGYDNLSEDHDYNAFQVAVDAITGQMLWWDTYSPTAAPPRLLWLNVAKEPRKPTLSLLVGGRPVAASYPPILVNRRPYIYLLNMPGLGTAMELLGPGEAKLTGANGTGYVDAKKGILIFNGQPFLRYGKPVIINGRTYVPLDFARRLLGVSLTVRRAPPYGG